jgi:hypothetical protein
MTGRRRDLLTTCVGCQRDDEQGSQHAVAHDISVSSK